MNSIVETFAERNGEAAINTVISPIVYLVTDLGQM